MRTFKDLLISIFQIIIGLATIISFVVVATTGENMLKWSIALIVAFIFIVVGVKDIIGYIKQKKDKTIID